MDEIICYCFDYTREDIARDLRENGRSTILERIADAKRFGNCQCASKNPKGT
jgi:NAD(P)H-nitrite reductase large subunit